MISVIIPTLNEIGELPSTLAALVAQGETLEVWVVDGGSDDGTVEIAREAGVFVLISDRRQRAHQLNLGASRARGEVFWFLHADTWVDPRAASSLRRVLEDPAVVGGGFERRFRSASPFLWTTSHLSTLRSRRGGWFFGDQSLFVRREVFEKVGGFPDVPVFEDWELCRRLKREGRLKCVGPPVRSSARRFARRGALWVTLRDLGWMLRYWRGESPESLWQRMGGARRGTTENERRSGS